MNRGKTQYKRMYETRNVRPYYTVPHLGLLGAPLKKLVGFGYKDVIYVTSPEMNNTGYFGIQEMQRASNYFKKFWENKSKTKSLFKKIRKGFKEAKNVEAWAWKQNWKKKSTPQLLADVLKTYGMLFEVFSTMFVSQPQHVRPLEEKIDILVKGLLQHSEIVRQATLYKGDLPWAKEERQIEVLHKRWNGLTKGQKDKALYALVEEYGWFNEVEGSQPFDKFHYLNKIKNFRQGKKIRLSTLKIPSEVKKVGHLIGELGFLRFWNRYHFMHLRYHVMKILQELTRRIGNPNFEFATVDEFNKYVNGKKIDLREIANRKHGYASYLKNGKAKIVTGKKAADLRNLVHEDLVRVTEVSGSVAHKGKVVGKVRIISFLAKDYHHQVKSFKKGEILVTGMTRPQIVHLCKIASAIVTDEGGITSHAAVVSREFNIPCIIGTHNATKILKTGDMVEVDANRGLVAILTQ